MKPLFVCIACLTVLGRLDMDSVEANRAAWERLYPYFIETRDSGKRNSALEELMTIAEDDGEPLDTRHMAARFLVSAEATEMQERFRELARPRTRDDLNEHERHEFQGFIANTARLAYWQVRLAGMRDDEERKGLLLGILRGEKILWGEFPENRYVKDWAVSELVLFGDPEFLPLIAEHFHIVSEAEAEPFGPSPREHKYRLAEAQIAVVATKENPFDALAEILSDPSVDYPQREAGGMEVHELYAWAATTLYRLDRERALPILINFCKRLEEVHHWKEGETIATSPPEILYRAFDAYHQILLLLRRLEGIDLDEMKALGLDPSAYFPRVPSMIFFYQ